MKSIWKLRLGILATIALVAGTVGFVGGGYAFAASGDVSGNVFDDVDSNGANNGEAGLANVIVTAYDAAGNTAGSATTDGSGDYTISGLTDGEQYRIEFTNLPTDYVDGPVGADSQSSVTFATPETTGVDFGAIVPEECAQPPAGALLNTYAAAVSCSAVVDPAYPKDSFGLIDIDSTVPASGRVNQSGSTPMFHHPDWHIDRIGNVFGTAVDNTRGDMFAAASSNYSHAFYTNTGAGVRPAIVQYGAIGGGANDLGAAGTLYKMDAMTGAPSVFVQLPQQSTTVTHRDCERNTTLNRTTGVGLGNVVYDETNDQLFVSNWEDGHIYRIAMDGTILDAYDPDATDDGSPGMANGRVPFALETANDGSRLYFGTVLGREVWSIDLTPTGGFTGGSSVIGGVTIHANSSSETLNQTISVTGGEPSPGWLNGNLMFFVSDLEILPAGQMLAGLRVGCSNSPHGAYNHQGQTHRLTANGAGLFTGDNGALNISATGDAGLDDNYGGVDFFNNPTTGTTQFAVTSADILAEVGPHGLAVFANSSAGGGLKSPLGAIDYGTDNDPKGIAGDVSVLNLQVCTPSPVQIGNRVWLDLDNNGVQDPGEAALVDVTVTLFASDGSTVLDTTTTDGNGEYAFGESSGVLPNTSYVLDFDPLTSSTSLPAGFTLADLFATAADVGAASNPDLTDSDMVGTTIAVTTGGPGENDHSYDAGFTLPYDLALAQVYTSDTFGDPTDGVVENGADVTFTITVTNQGYAPANSFEVIDYLPAGFILNDAAWTDNGDGTASFNAGALGSGSSVDIPLTLTADSAGAGDLVNWAEISVDDGNDIDSTPDTDRGNDAQPAAVGDPTDDVIDNSGGDEDDHDPAGVTVIAYDLALTKTYTSDTFGDPSDGVVENGADVTFTITVTNQGTVTANSFEVTDYLPSGFTLNDAAWTDNGDGTATYGAGALMPGASVDIPLTLSATSAGAGPLVNWAEISSDDGNDADSTPDADQSNDNQPAAPGDPTDDVIDNSPDGAGDPDEDDHDPAGIVVDAYDLALAQVYTSDTFDGPTDGVIEQGADVTFTITVTNQGTVAANSFEVTDYLPAGFTLNDAAWTDNGDGTATYSAGPLATGSSVDIPLTLTATSTADGDYVNWAEISVDDGNDADSSPDSNQGNDNQPAGPGDPTDGVVDNTDGDEDDHDPAGVTVGSYDLALTKAYTSDTFANTTDGVLEAGEDVTFTIEVTNQGSLDATTYTITDHLPAGFVLNDGAWADGGTTATIASGPLPAGASEQITITLTATTAGDGAHVNWAEISSDDGNDVDSTPDTDRANDNQPVAPGDPTDGVIDNSNGDEDDHDPAGVLISSYDLALTQVYTSDTFGNTGDGVVENGADVTFTITVTNQGSAVANSFEVTDYLPSGFTLNDAAWTDNGDGTATFNAGPLLPGATVDIPLTLTADSAGAGDLVNWAEISADDGADIDSTPDTDQGNDAQPAAVGDPTDDVIDNSGGDEDDHDPAGVTVIAYDLALTKTYTSDTFGDTTDGVVENGADVTFTITVTNQGTVTANSFAVTDYVPAGFSVNDAAWTDNGDGTATFNAGPLAVGASVDLTITLRADSATDGVKENWAEISVDDGNDADSSPDSNQGNDNQPAAPGDPTDGVIDNSGGDEDDHDVAGFSVASYDLALMQVYTSDTYGDPTDGVVEFASGVTFTVTVTNQGTVDAASFELVDYIPAGLTLDDAAWTDNGDGTATYSAGALLAGESIDVPITFTVSTQTAGEIVNWAEISVDDGNDADSTPDTDEANDAQPAAVGDPTDDVIDNSGGDEDDHDPAGVAVEIFDLALTKAYTSDTFGDPTDGVIESGANVLFTITVTNQGTIDATTFAVTDHLPAGFSVNDAAWTDNGDGTATFTAGVLLAGSSVDIPVTLRADAVSPGMYVNWAELSSDDGTDVDSTPDSDPSNDNQPSSPGDPTDDVVDNTDGDEDDHDPAAVGVANYDLALIKSYTSDTFGAPTDGVVENGADVTFTITVINQGTIDASSFEVTDYPPAGFDLNDAAWTDNGDGTATFSAGPLLGGASVQIPVTLTANGAAAGDQVNRAEISVDDGNDIDSTPDADQVNDNQPVAPGDPTDDVTDNSNGDEDDHDIAGFSVVAYDLALSQVYTSDTFGDPSDGVIENGADVTFTITVQNQGMIDATNFSVTNYIPTGFVLNDAAWTDNGDGTATISTGPLPSGASVDIPVTLTADSAVAGALVNWAEISADDGNDVDSTPNTDQGDDNQPAAVGDPTDDVTDNSNGDEDDHDPAGVTVAEYDLALRKVYTSDTFANPTDGRVEIGSDVTFTITVFNQGDLDATAITITDYLPSGFVLNDAAWTDNGNRTANRAGFGPIAAGDSLSTTITMTATTANTGEAKNVAEISRDDGNDVDSNPDGGLGNDNQPTDPGDPTDDVIDNADGDEDDHDIAGVVVDRYDLALITTFASDTFGDPTDGVIEPNTDVTFEVTLTNQGTIDAADVEVTAYMPTGFVLNDPSWTDNGDGTATFTGIALTAGDGDPVTIPITTTGVGVTTGTYVLWAEISVDDGNDVDSNPDTDQANDNQPSSPGDPTDDVVDNTDGDEDDHDPAAVGVENYDLALIKSLSDDGFGDPNDGLTEDGADATFTITVINQGTLDAASFEVTDHLPAGFVLDDAAWTDNGDGTVSFSAGALSSGASVDIPLQVTLTGVADGDYVNVAEISADDGNDIDSNPDTDQANDNQPANPGDPTDDVTNNALDGAGDPDEDDHDLAGLTVGSFDLALVKTYTSDTSTDGNATDGRVQPGDDVTFTITVINQGDLDAASFEITDHLPTGFVLNDAAWSNGGAGTATITGGALAASESVDITITMTATGRIAGDVVNVAEISSDAGNDVDSTPNGDPDDDDQPAEPGDPTDDVVDNTDGDEDDHDIAGLTLDVYDLELEKVFVSDTSADGNATDGRIQIGDDATFTIRVANAGTVDAASFEVTDYLPVGFELNDPAWTDNGDGTASITRGALPAGGSDSISITITSVSNGAGQHVNWAEISTDDGDDIDSTPNDDPDDDGDPPTEDDIDDAPLTVEAYDLALRKVRTSDISVDGNATDGLIEVGDDVTFTITVFNQGTADANSVEVTDYLPNGFTVSDAAWTDNGDGTATTTTGPLAAGASLDLTFTMTATSANVGDHLNGAEISADDGVDVDSAPNTDPSDDGTVTDDEIDNNNGDEDDHDTAPVRVVPPSELAPVTLALGNVVWFDDDFDGIFDADEDPVSGVTLVLFDGNGQPILGADGEPRSVVTASDGTYLFDGLAEGTYIVAVVGSNFAPGGPLADVVTTVGNDVAAGLAPDPDDDVDEDDNGSFVLGGGAVSQPIVLAIGLEPDGNVNLTVDFGFIPAAGLGSLVWFDNDRDGAQDSSEAGVPDVEVTVTHVASGRVFGRDTTDATGNWSVTGLPPGDYTVTFDDPENRTYTSIDRGDDALDSDAQPDGTTGTVELSAGEYDPTIDAGILPPQPTPPTIAFTGSAWAMALLAWAIGLGFVGWALLLMSRDPRENPYLS